jgi:integrase/predicted DNA-binding transcriptional regulator AlpA
MLKLREVCQLFGVSPGWVYRRTRRTSRDRIPCVRLGRCLRFEAEAVKAYLDARRTFPTPVIVDIAGGTGRVRRVQPMPRTQFQQGGIRKKGNRLYGYYRELIERSDGLVVKKKREVALGWIGQMSIKQARAKLHSILEPVNRRGTRPRYERRLKEFVEEVYKPLKVCLLKPSARASYGGILKNHILTQPIAGLELSEVSSEQAQRFLNQKLASKELDWDTVRNIRIVFSSVMQLAVKYGYLDRNPVRGTTLPPEPERPATPLPDEAGLHRLIQHLGLMDGIIIRLLAKTGLRIGELRALRWRRINLEKRTLEVASSLFRGEFSQPKSRKGLRTIDLDPDAADMLRAWRTRNPEVGEDALVFASSKNPARPFAYSRALERLQKTARSLGLPHVTFHRLRHWNATVMDEAGVPMRVMQARLGHSSLHTTERYLEARRQEGMRAAEAVSERLRLGSLTPELGGRSGGREAREEELSAVYTVA